MSGVRKLREAMAGNTLLHVAFAFVMMGGWAVFANRSHTVPEMLLAGLVQGTISGLLTLGLKKFLEWFSARMRGLPALIVPPLITATTILAILWSAHMVAGTPEIFATIAFPFSVSTTYAILYNLRLWRQANGR